MLTFRIFILAIVSVLVASMAIFAVISKSRPMDLNIAQRSSSVLIGRWLRDWLVWLVGPVERTMVLAKLSPTALNIAGALFGLAAGVAFFDRRLALAGTLILLGGLADVLDGRIARARGIADSRGAFLDSTLDRFSESFTFAGVILFFSDRPVPLFAAAAALGGSMLVSYTRARGEGLGVSNSSGVMQRAERLVLLAIGALADRFISITWNVAEGSTLAFVLGLIAIGAYATAIYRTVAIARDLAQKKDRTLSRSDK